MNRVLKVLIVLTMLVIIGTIGYVLIEGWSAADGFFMTVITLSTVGYGETQPLSPEGRSFTAVTLMNMKEPGSLNSVPSWTSKKKAS